MSIICINDQAVDGPWQYVNEVSGARNHDFVVFSADGLQAFGQLPLDTTAKHLGVRLEVDDDLAAIVEHLPRLALVELEFPHFKDGRRYSTAVELRRKFGFSGDLRASGDFLPDQALFLIRCGFSSIIVPKQFSLEQFKISLSAYSVAYQADYCEPRSLIVGLRGTTPMVSPQ